MEILDMAVKKADLLKKREEKRRERQLAEAEQHIDDTLEKVFAFGDSTKVPISERDLKIVLDEATVEYFRRRYFDWEIGFSELTIEGSPHRVLFFS